MDYSERLMRAGDRRAARRRLLAPTTYIDGYLDDPDPARSDLPIVVTITMQGDEHDRRPDRHRAAGARPADQHAARGHGRLRDLADAPLGPARHATSTATIPQNSGLTRPITIVAPEGCLANPIFPAPVIARFCPGNAARRHGDEGAVRRPCRGRSAAGIGNLRVIAFSGLKEGDALGAHGDLRGQLRRPATAWTAWMRSTRSMPTRATTRSRTSRSHLPLRVAALRTARERGRRRQMARRHRLDPRVRLPGRRRRFGRGRRPAIPAVGFSRRRRRHAGEGGPGARGGGTEDLPSKIPYRHIAKGGRFTCYGPCGGGYGDPMSATRRGADDVLDGLIGAQTARRDYGVVISAKGVVDEAATAKLRAAG